MRKSNSVLILLENNSLQVEELKELLDTNDVSKILYTVCSSFCDYLVELKNQDDLPHNNYLENFMKTVVSILENNSLNVVNSLKLMKNIENRINGSEFKLELKPIYNNLEKLLSKKIVIGYKENSIKFLRTIIYDIKKISFLRYILENFPDNVNIYDENKKHIFIEIIDHFLLSLDEGLITEETIYYNNILLEFMSKNRFHLTSEEIKKILNKVQNKMSDIKEADNEQIYLYYKNIIDKLLEKKITEKNIDEIKTKHNISTEFSIDILKEIENFTKNNFIITIDSEDTLDMDDALSIEKFSDHYHLKVYIANVASIIPFDSLTNEEAFKKTESIYLSDTTINMFHPQLCTDYISLNTNNPKNVLQYAMDIYFNGEIANFNISTKSIVINRKFSYNEVNRLLNNPTNFSNYNYLFYLDELATILRKNNPNKNLYREAEDLINKEKLIYTHKSEYVNRTKSEIIIEELMILINISIARKFYNEGYPFIYRVHEKPSDSEEFGRLLRFKKMIETNYSQKENYVKIVESLMNMYPPAYYSLDNIGHFGLGLDYYCHGTSPIRRYPDLLGQRLQFEYFFSKPDRIRDRYWSSVIRGTCQYCNDRILQDKDFQKDYETAKILLKRK